MKNDTFKTTETTETKKVIVGDTFRRKPDDDDPLVVGPDGLVTHLSDLLGQDRDSWDYRH